MKNKVIDEAHLRHLNSARKLINLERALDIRKQLMIAISSQRLPDISRILATALRHGSSVYRIIELVHQAAAGVYHPRGYSDEDLMRGHLFLSLAGKRVADIAHRTMDTPSTSTLRRNRVIPTLHASPGVPTSQELAFNLDASLSVIQKELQAITAGGTLHAVLMFDELAVEKRLRWDDRTNCILGIARESVSKAGLEFTSMADIELLLDEIEKGEVELASEATVGALGFLGSNDTSIYSARPFLLSGSSKRERAEDHADLIRTAISSVNTSPHCQHIRIVNIASDGEARRGRALALLALRVALSPTSSIYSMLSTLRLMDLLVGSDDITIDKDYKHIFKRLRNAILRRLGILVNGVVLLSGVVRTHLEDAGHSQEHLNSVFNVSDRQDVTLAYQLLRDIWQLPPDSRDPLYSQTREALRTFGQMCRHLILPYICIELTLAEQLSHLSAAAHLALGLYTAPGAGSRFLPPQLFFDIMLMVKNVYFTVAKAKVDHPDSPFFLVLLGTDRLESLFGIIRTIVGSDVNVDMRQLADRVTATIVVSTIFAIHPEWDQSPRRLHLPMLTREEVPIEKADHIRPRDFTADLTPGNITLQTTWKLGRREAEDAFGWISERLDAIEAIPGATILAPTGTLLVH
ncbi:hypothetical protein CONPUDRAFT_62603, partial [Coniophora puteana RWD-64-598 SS2]